MEHISVTSRRNPINLYITEKFIKFSKLFGKEKKCLVFPPLFFLSEVPSRTCCVCYFVCLIFLSIYLFIYFFKFSCSVYVLSSFNHIISPLDTSLCEHGLISIKINL